MNQINYTIIIVRKENNFATKQKYRLMVWFPLIGVNNNKMVIYQEMVLDLTLILQLKKNNHLIKTKQLMNQ